MKTRNIGFPAAAILEVATAALASNTTPSGDRAVQPAFFRSDPGLAVRTAQNTSEAD